MLKTSAIGNAIVLISPILLGGVFASLLPAGQNVNPGVVFFYLGLLLLIIGWIFLVYLKWPQIKNKTLNKLGLINTSNTQKRNYVFSYGLLVLGFSLTVLAMLKWALATLAR